MNSAFLNLTGCKFEFSSFDSAHFEFSSLQIHLNRVVGIPGFFSERSAFLDGLAGFREAYRISFPHQVVVSSRNEGASLLVSLDFYQLNGKGAAVQDGP